MIQHTIIIVTEIIVNFSDKSVCNFFKIIFLDCCLCLTDGKW